MTKTTTTQAERAEVGTTWGEITTPHDIGQSLRNTVGMGGLTPAEMALARQAYAFAIRAQRAAALGRPTLARALCHAANGQWPMPHDPTDPHDPRSDLS